MSTRSSKLIADPRASHIMNCGYGRGFSVLEVLDAVDRVTNLRIERAAGAAPRGRSGLAGRRQSQDPRDPALAARSCDDLDTIVAHALAWERKLAERG